MGHHRNNLQRNETINKIKNDSMKWKLIINELCIHIDVRVCMCVLTSEIFGGTKPR